MEKTIAKVGYAVLNTNSSGEISYGDVNWFESTKAGGREISADPQGELQEVEADGIVALALNNNGGYNITLTLLDIIDDINTDWLGKKKLNDGTIVEVADASTPPRFALLVAKETINGDKIYNVDTYYNCTASRNGKSAKSSKPGEAIDFEFPQFNIAARPRETDKIVHSEKGYDVLPSQVAVPTIPEGSASGSANEPEDDGE